MKRLLAATYTFTILGAAVALWQSSLPARSEIYFPGWEDQAMKLVALEGCMIDYAIYRIDKKQSREYQKFRKRHKIKLENEWEMRSRLSKYPDWKDRYNQAIKIINEDCYQIANALNPGTFRIDYNLGGKRGWRQAASSTIVFRECLNSDKRFSENLKERLVNTWINSADPKPTPHDIKNILIRKEDPRLKDDMDFARETSGVGTQRCKDKLSKLARLHNLSTRSAPRLTSNGAHAKCLEAKDYEGCIRVTSRIHKPQPQADVCGDYWCIAKSRSKDLFGFQRPLGWLYRERNDGMSVIYLNPIVWRIPHKGQEQRYLASKTLVRYYQQPEAGSSGSFIGGTSSSTSCIGYGGSVNCSTTSQPGNYLPGRSSTPAGIRLIKTTRVIDCKDKTYGWYKQEKLSGDWNKISANQVIENRISSYCNKASSLPVLKMKL